ncbi:MAG: ATP-dependent helicase HrpB, partial [Desulfuromonadales bacterium]|nr:ATP-dependent helicase HrpB [Desulfuromonadales bacterium]
MSSSSPTFPVDRIIPALKDAFAESRVVLLQAPPGTGKTTRIPPALLNADWLRGQSIVMLEPRRLAASGAAGFMAKQRGEAVGETIGYTIRYERKVSKSTQIEVVTEGLLTRRLQRDTELSGVGLVIFDEFHERSLHTDLAFALCRDIQQNLRDDLRLLIMSATLDLTALTKLFGEDCPLLCAQAQIHPVDVHYLSQSLSQLAQPMWRIAETTVKGVRQALSEVDGDLLVFLPGAGEIRRCQKLLADLEPTVQLCPLFGGLSFAEQQKAILPGKGRRVVLATNVAETSLTIEGISAVVDSGWERRPRFDAARGMDLLETVRISRASAEQRAGRAGRLGPGSCYRLWSQGEQGALLPHAPTQIRQADLAPLAFDLAQWGADPQALDWPESPPQERLASARQLLTQLGALNNQGRISDTGRAMAKFPAHPRIARLLVECLAQDCPELGAELATLLSEPGSYRERDLLARLEQMRREGRASMKRALRYWQKRIGGRRTGRQGKVPLHDPFQLGRLLACAFPDRLAKKRPGGAGRFLLRNGSGAVLADSGDYAGVDWLVVIELFSRDGADTQIRLAAPLMQQDVESLFAHELSWRREVVWDDSARRVVARELRRLGAIVAQERPVKAAAEDTAPALLEYVRRRGLDQLSWSRDAAQLRSRVVLLYQHFPDSDWPDWSDKALLDSLEEWLLPFLVGVRSRDSLKRIDL